MERWQAAIDLFTRDELGAVSVADDGGFEVSNACSSLSTHDVAAVAPCKLELVATHEEPLTDQTGEEIDVEICSTLWTGEPELVVLTCDEHWQAGNSLRLTRYTSRAQYDAALADAHGAFQTGACDDVHLASAAPSVGPPCAQQPSIMNPIDIVFRHLDTWRHLPAYQLERRADIFFSVYLKGVVEEFTGVALEDEIIPELPIKRDLIWPEYSTDKSVKVDYALFAKDRSRVFFVELKTDGASRRDAQDAYLETAKRLGFRPIAEGIRSILLKTTAHQKYNHLATSLARLGYLSLPPDLSSWVYPTARPGLLAKLAAITVNPSDTPVEVIYLQPAKTDSDRCIDFEDFALHVSRFDDPFSRIFAEHLRRWTHAAGSRVPG